MGPIPRAVTFAELNPQLLPCCRRRLNDRQRGDSGTIGERLVRDREALLPLPPAPYDACEKKREWVTRCSLERDIGPREHLRNFDPTLATSPVARASSQTMRHRDPPVHCLPPEDYRSPTCALGCSKHAR